MLTALVLVALAQTPLISRDLLLGSPERANPRVSPDAKGVLQVWVK